MKGGEPVSSSNKITPNAQMSDRPSTSRTDVICSGDM